MLELKRHQGHLEICFLVGLILIFISTVHFWLIFEAIVWYIVKFYLVDFLSRLSHFLS